MLRQLITSRPVFFRVVFAIAFITALALFVGGFFCPPKGVIDGSLLKAAGILLGFATMSMLPDLVYLRKKATIKHGDTEITLGELDNEAERHICDTDE